MDSVELTGAYGVHMKVNSVIRPFMAILDTPRFEVTLGRTFIIMNLSTFSTKSVKTRTAIGKPKKWLACVPAIGVPATRSLCTSLVTRA